MKTSKDETKLLLLMYVSQPNVEFKWAWFPLLEIMCTKRDNFFATFNALQTDQQIRFIQSLCSKFDNTLAQTIFMLMKENGEFIENENIRLFLMDLFIEAQPKVANKINELLDSSIDAIKKNCYKQAENIELFIEHQTQCAKVEQSRRDLFKQYGSTRSKAFEFEYKKAGYEVELVFAQQAMQCASEQIAKLEQLLRQSNSAVLELRNRESVLKEEQSQLLREESKLKQTLAKAKEEVQKIKRNNEEMPSGIKELNDEIQKLHESRTKLDDEILKKQEDLKIYRSDVDGVKKKLKEIMASAEMMQADNIKKKVKDVFTLLPPDEFEKERN